MCTMFQVDVRKVLPKEVKEQKDALFKGQVPCAGYAGFAGAQGGLIESAYGGYGIGRGLPLTLLEYLIYNIVILYIIHTMG